MGWTEQDVPFVEHLGYESTCQDFTILFLRAREFVMMVLTSE
jgi:hypothetical protein